MTCDEEFIAVGDVGAVGLAHAATVNTVARAVTVVSTMRRICMESSLSAVVR